MHQANKTSDFHNLRRGAVSPRHRSELLPKNNLTRAQICIASLAGIIYGGVVKRGLRVFGAVSKGCQWSFPTWVFIYFFDKDFRVQLFPVPSLTPFLLNYLFFARISLWDRNVNLQAKFCTLEVHKHGTFLCRTDHIGDLDEKDSSNFCKMICCWLTVCKLIIQIDVLSTCG